MAAVWRMTRQSLVAVSVRTMLCQGVPFCGCQCQATVPQHGRSAKTWTQGSPELEALIRWNSENKKLFGPLIKSQGSKSTKTKKKSKKKTQVAAAPRLLEEKFFSGADSDAVDFVEVGQSEQEVFRSLPKGQTADSSDVSNESAVFLPRNRYHYTLSSSEDPFSSDSNEANLGIPEMVPPPFMPSDAVLRADAKSKIAGYNPVASIPTPKFKPPPTPSSPPAPTVTAAERKAPNIGTSTPLPEIPELDAILELPLFQEGSDLEWRKKLEPYVEFVSRLEARTPTVNQVLSKTQSDLSRFFLQRWREKMIAELGEVGFKLHHEETLRNGILLHHLIQQYLGGADMAEVQVHSANQGHWRSVEPVFSQVGQVQALESPVSHPQLLYRGTLDCVAAYRGKQRVIDWKTSKKPKPELSNTYDNPLQVVAYLGAIQAGSLPELDGVDGGAIVVVYPDGSPAHVHTLDRQQCQQQWRLWLQRLKQYWQTVALERGVVPHSSAVKQ